MDTRREKVVYLSSPKSDEAYTFSHRFGLSASLSHGSHSGDRLDWGVKVELKVVYTGVGGGGYP